MTHFLLNFNNCNQIASKFSQRNILIQRTSSRPPIWMKLSSKFSSVLRRQTCALSVRVNRSGIRIGQIEGIVPKMNICAQFFKQCNKHYSVWYFITLNENLQPSLIYMECLCVFECWRLNKILNPKSKSKFAAVVFQNIRKCRVMKKKLKDKWKFSKYIK